LIVAPVLWWFVGQAAPWRVLAGTASVVTFVLSGVYLWLLAANIWQQGRVPAALAMAACPVGLAGVVWFNAGYFLRREAAGAQVRVGWVLSALLAGSGLGGVGAWLGSGDSAGSSKALAGDPNVLIVTIDTLRRDHVSAYGTGHASTPRMDALAEEGLLFLDAVTPTPETGPSHAALFTALHPLRSQVLSNGHELAGGYETLAERLQDEGYATGAFVSSFAVDSRLGLDQGFDVYDDDFLPLFRGVTDLVAGRFLVPLLFKIGRPEDMPWLLERLGHETNRRASDWIRGLGDRPWMTWVHYFEPHAPYESPDQTVDHRALLSQPDHDFTEEEADALRAQYSSEATLADTLVGQLLDLLDELDVADNTLVVVTSDHGEQLGEHGIMFHHHGLYDESLRIPLIMRAPGLKGVVNRRIESQVRMMDIAPTVLKYIKLDPLAQAEGAELLGYATGVRSRDLACPLYGRREASLREGVLFGLRASDVKYILDPGSGVEELYNLVNDPAEARDLSQDPLQAEPLAQCRRQVAPDAESLGHLAPAADQTTLDRLEALGYTE
jgi:choline-sulfatase